MRRVVVTGYGVCSPLGDQPDHVFERVLAGDSGVVRVDAFDDYKGLKTRLCAPAVPTRTSWPRKRVRTMGRVAMLSVEATERALQMAGIAADDPMLSGGRVGISHGSTHGSSSAMEEALQRVIAERTFEGLPSSSYFKYMSHTTAANLAIDFSVRGRIIPTCSACTSGSQGVGYGMEAIRSGAADVMICGGAEELHPLAVGTFDIMFATSTVEDPELAPRPFHRERDGMVVGEGAGTLILESLEHAQARGATILAEVIGFGTNCDGEHATSPSSRGMADAMRLALADANIDAGDVGHINAHGTATPKGDEAEAAATRDVMGAAVPIVSTKSHMGHTLGACGAIESILAIESLRRGVVPATRGLSAADVDPACEGVLHVFEPVRRDQRVVMSNNFAFGGVNTSLLFARPDLRG